LFGFV
jgi:hypothetical protein